MPNYSFQETASFFAERMNAILPSSLIEDGIELSFDTLVVSMRPSQQQGSVTFSLTLGLLLHPILETHVRELMSSHFVGINTGGCTIAFDEAGVLLFLKAVTSPFTPPQENWEWTHRLICVAHEWMKILSLWDEFVPLLHLPKVSQPIQGSRKV